jgi:hypothetical protein
VALGGVQHSPTPQSLAMLTHFVVDRGWRWGEGPGARAGAPCHQAHVRHYGLVRLHRWFVQSNGLGVRFGRFGWHSAMGGHIAMTMSHRHDPRERGGRCGTRKPLLKLTVCVTSRCTPRYAC